MVKGDDVRHTGVNATDRTARCATYEEDNDA